MMVMMIVMVMIMGVVVYKFCFMPFLDCSPYYPSFPLINLASIPILGKGDLSRLFHPHR